MLILVLNCGSSSVKYKLFDMSTELARVAGSVERIGEDDPSLIHNWEGGQLSAPTTASDHEEALARIRAMLVDPLRGGVRETSEISAVGHRVVHGGERFVSSTLVIPEVERAIEEHSYLAPLHNPSNLEGIRAARQFFPGIPHVAVFDTAFHQSMPRAAFIYGIPYRFYVQDRIRRYGFHGISHRYVSERAARILGKSPDTFTGITCHLGNGCSLTAVRNGRSVDTSMGMTPLEGVMMGTRSGDIDPAVMHHLVEHQGMTLGEVSEMLNRESGLLGLSGISNDMREVLKAAERGIERAELAVEVYAYRIRKYIGAYLAALGEADAIVFTGGVGENAHTVRHRILTGLDHLGIVLNPEVNMATRGSEGDISTKDSPIRILVVPTNEELMIAREATAIASAHLVGAEATLLA